MKNKAGKIPNNSIIQVFGWVMLRNVPEGKYRVRDLGDGTYQFYRPRGQKAITRHYINDVDCFVRNAGHLDNNKIVVISE